MTAWISVKERLPEDEGLYLTYNAEWTGGYWVSSWKDGSFYGDPMITHWQPLPPPPDLDTPRDEAPVGGKVV